MEIKIISERDNKLLHRKEYAAVVTHLAESTPTRQVTRDKLAAHVNADKDRTAVIKIEKHFGIAQSNITFRVYENQDQLLAVELSHIAKRNGFTTEEEKK